MGKAYAKSNPTAKHSEEIAFLNALVIDLKMATKTHYDFRQIAIDYGITPSRLDEATHIISKLEQHKEQVKFK